MISRTPWRITHWNAETVGATLIIGIGGSTAEIRLRNTETGAEHTIGCAGASGSYGTGVSIRNVSLPAGLYGLQSESRTQGGRLYRNNYTIRRDLTLQHLLDSWICVQGVELSIRDEGQAGYLVIFASGGATLSTFLGGGGLLSEALAIATCRAITFLSTGQAGLPSAQLAGYRYKIIGEV
jgi:hypothetical protein